MDQNQQKADRFLLEETLYIDSVVRPLVPRPLKALVEALNPGRLGRIAHFLVDVVWLGQILGLKISRAQDTELLGGKGFRKGINHGYKVNSVTTTIKRRGVVIGEKKFSIGVHFKK